MTGLGLIPVVLIGYLLGSVPFGLLLTRAAGLGDIRAIGSGSIGATNVLRTGNKKIAALTLLLDAAKGAVAVLIARHMGFSYEPWAALAALAGHLFPIWLRFKGGKGAAVGLGIMLVLCWPAGLAVGATWGGMVKRFKISSLASLTASGIAPIYVMLFGRTDLVPWVLGMTLLIFWKHRENIQRLAHRTEPKIGAA